MGVRSSGFALMPSSSMGVRTGVLRSALISARAAALAAFSARAAASSVASAESRSAVRLAAA